MTPVPHPPSIEALRIQETFRREAHGGGHLLLHVGAGGYVSVAADGVKVAADRESAEVFSVETVERGEEAVARAAAGADTVIVVAGNDPHVNRRATEDRTTLALPAHQDRLWWAAHAANPRTVPVSSSPYAVPEAAGTLARSVTASVPRPHRELVAHERTSLAPGASATPSFTVPSASLGYGDVAHGRWTVEPGGGYGIQVGASSADIRRTVRVEVAGEGPGPRSVLTDGLAAADYDEQSGTVVVDRTKVSGDAVAPAAPRREGELLHRSCDFAAGVTEAAVTAAGEGAIELVLTDGTPLARIELAPTGGPCAYRTLTAPLRLRDGTDLRIRLHGPVRPAQLGFTPA